MVHCRCNNSRPLIPNTNQLNPAVSTHTFFFKTYLLIFFHLCLGLQVAFITSDFRTKILCVTLHSPIDATCPAVSFSLIWLAEQCLVKIQQWRSSLYDFLYFYVNPPFFGPNVSFSALIANNSGNGGPRPNPEKKNPWLLADRTKLWMTS